MDATGQTYKVRGFMKILVITILFTVSSLVGADRPNILWITSEDNSPYLGCYGDALAQTPNLDGLAAQGVRYRNAFANSPVCSSARTTLAMGMYAASLGAENHRSSVAIPAHIKLHPETIRQAGYYYSYPTKTDYNIAGGRNIGEEVKNRGHYRNRAAGQPFFAVFNLGASHEGSVAPKKGKTMFRIPPEKVKLPPYHPDSPEIRKDWANYYDQMTIMDSQAGKVLQELDKEGLADDTIVFYFADHGGALPRGKRNLHDSGTRIPLIIRFPKKWEHLAPAKPGEWVNEPVSFVDFPATLMSLCSIPIPTNHQGKAFLGKQKVASRQPVLLTRARMDERYDTVRALTDGKFRYIRNYSPHRSWGQHYSYAFQVLPSMRSWHAEFEAGRCNDVQAAYWNEKPGEEFYHTTEDKFEVTNKIAHATLKSRIDEFRKGLNQRILAIRDTAFIPEGMYKRLAGEKTIYDYAQSDAYPLERILDLANKASDRNQANLPEFIAALEHKNPVIRYWAAMGCLILKEKASAAKEKLRNCLKDDWPDVRVVAAEAIAYMGESKAALDAVAEVIKNGNSHEGLAAQNALDYMSQAGHVPLATAKVIVRDLKRSEPADRIPRYLLAK